MVDTVTSGLDAKSAIFSFFLWIIQFGIVCSMGLGKDSTRSFRFQSASLFLPVVVPYVTWFFVVCCAWSLVNRFMRWKEQAILLLLQSVYRVRLWVLFGSHDTSASRSWASHGNQTMTKSHQSNHCYPSRHARNTQLRKVPTGGQTPHSWHFSCHFKGGQTK